MKLSNQAIRRIAQMVPYQDDAFFDKIDPSELLTLSSSLKTAYDYYWEIYEARMGGDNIENDLHALRNMLSEIAVKAQELQE